MSPLKMINNSLLCFATTLNEFSANIKGILLLAGKTKKEEK